MKEYFVLSDIHSFYKEMQEALLKEGFDRSNPNHIIIVCGDMLDRGDESLAVVDFFYNLLKEDRCILVRGNHEDLFENMIESRHFSGADISNGTLKTLCDLQPEKMNSLAIKHLFFEACEKYDKRWDELRSNMVNYYELGKYIFVHAWIPTKTKPLKMSEYYWGGPSASRSLYDPDWRNASEFEFQESRWVNGMEYADAGIIEPGKIIVCGHWHSSYGNVRKKYPNKSYQFYKDHEFNKKDDSLFDIYYGNGIIAIDACTAYTKRCNCLHLKESDIYETKDSNS